MFFDKDNSLEGVTLICFAIPAVGGFQNWCLDFNKNYHRRIEILRSRLRWVDDFLIAFAVVYENERSTARYVSFWRVVRDVEVSSGVS